MKLRKSERSVHPTAAEQTPTPPTGQAAAQVAAKTHAPVDALVPQAELPSEQGSRPLVATTPSRVRGDWLSEANHPPQALTSGASNRPTRAPTFEELTAAADRAQAFAARDLSSPELRIVSSAPLSAKLGGPVLDEAVQNVTVDLGGGLRHLINQDVLFKLAPGAASAFKRGFFETNHGVGPQFKVVASEHDGKWSKDASGDPWAMGGGRFIVEAQQAKIGTDLPGVAPATAFLMVDPKTLIENAHETSFVIQFLNPWNADGSFPPYTESLGRYGIRDHGDGSATVFAYWEGKVGRELLEPTIRETSVGKGLKAGWDFATGLAGKLPLVGGLNRAATQLIEQTTLATAKAVTAAGDAVLSATGLTEQLFPLAALQHVRFYERDFLNPERWAGPDATTGEAPQRRLAPESELDYAQRSLRSIRGEGDTARRTTVV